jgi:hypothetical protein
MLHVNRSTEIRKTQRISFGIFFWDTGFFAGRSVSETPFDCDYIYENDLGCRAGKAYLTISSPTINLSAEDRLGISWPNPGLSR